VLVLRSFSLFFLTASAWLMSSLAASAFAAEPVTIGQSVPQPAEYFPQIMLSLFLVLGIIVVSVWLVKRFGRFSGMAEGSLRILGVLAVGQREKVLLVQVGDEQLLLGVTASRITNLHKLASPIEVTETNNSAFSAGVGSKSFAQNLQDALKNMPLKTSVKNTVKEKTKEAGSEISKGDKYD